MHVIKEIEIGGMPMTFEVGKYAKQAGGSVMVRYGDTMALVTACAKEEPIVGGDFLPLQVEYRERTASVGRIPGGFFKREGRPSEKEILSARLIDRPIRPMFPENWRCETQVVITIFSSDMLNDADVLGACGASTALILSNIPFTTPIAEVRVGRVEGKFVINPTFKQLEDSEIDITIAGTADSILMVEGESAEVSEELLLEALQFGHEAVAKICKMQEELRKECGSPKREVPPPAVAEDFVAQVNRIAQKKVAEITRKVLAKEERSDAMKALRAETLAAVLAETPAADEAAQKLMEKSIYKVVDDIEYVEMREMILAENKRLDGRNTKQIRPITCEVGLLPRTHGSALFTRGETQSLTTVTLGTKLDEQMIEGMHPETTKRFMLHYNFPPYSVGEVGRFGTPGRREIGHGNLAERALKRVAPKEADFPYTMRIVSDILESNGSSSMATVCAGSLALFDGGVPMPKPVAGIAMGLIKEKDRVAVLSDILGNEDHLGDMDFKVAGTRDGITAFQMDIKIQGISMEIIKTALHQAKEGRLHILGEMAKAIDKPRPDVSPFAPRLTTLKVPVDMIGAVIGPGGKTIRGITEASGAEVNIEDDGTVTVAAVDSAAADKAIEMIKKIVELPEEGKVYHGRVTQIKEGIGAIVEFLPKREGLVHISQLDFNRVENVDDVVHVGDEFDVKLLEVRADGKYSLSRRACMPQPEGFVEPERRRHEGGDRRDGHRGGDRDRRGGGGYRGGRR
ncbi:MAG TPA: polyribonucleotide nucleotidyltransferase [Candidatus Kapabacteria bacterium]|nr:polyribonucleotide nucleotidyltransferase [Candidatus Kapabacteria bacterium]